MRLRRGKGIRACLVESTSLRWWIPGNQHRKQCPCHLHLPAAYRPLFLPAVAVSRCLRFRAACLACLESARCDAAARGSRFRAALLARDLFADGLDVPPLRPFSRSRSAFSCVEPGVAPSFGADSFTPARRAFESPIAIACFVDRAPCLPSRMCSISSRTNSPACVAGAFPSRLSCRARSRVSFSGIDSRSGQ